MSTPVIPIQTTPTTTPERPFRLASTLRTALALVFAASVGFGVAAVAQTPITPQKGFTIEPFGSNSNPLTQPTLSPGVITLMELEGRFAKDVAAGGGKAFAKWFADDAVTLNNGLPAVLGRGNIAMQAQWDPKQYQLTWVPQGAQMGPSNDMGFTWGHYEGHSVDKAGQPLTKTGRYMTVWKKLPNGEWKVAMDASADEPPNAGECCTLPKP